MTERDTIDRYFMAMRRGPTAEDDLLELFADDAVYVEPFTGAEEPARGIDEIRSRFRIGWEFPMPELELDVLKVEVDGSDASTRWECRSPALPGPIVGEDRYKIVDGKIAYLEVRILEND